MRLPTCGHRVAATKQKQEGGLMSSTNERATLPARTHADAALLRRGPFAPGAIGFRAMMNPR